MTSNFSTQESLRKTRHRRPHRMKNEEGCWGEVAMMTSIIMIHLRATPRSDHCLQSQWEISISLMTLLLLNLLSNSSIMPAKLTFLHRDCWFHWFKHLSFGSIDYFEIYYAKKENKEWKFDPCWTSYLKTTVMTATDSKAAETCLRDL